MQVRARVLELIASDPGLQQAELVLLGLFGRAARLLGGDANASSGELQSAAAEAGSLVCMVAVCEVEA
jgi:MoxR-like ATPase